MIKLTKEPEEEPKSNIERAYKQKNQQEKKSKKKHPPEHFRVLSFEIL